MTVDGGTLVVEPARHTEDAVEFYDVPVELAVLGLAGTTVAPMPEVFRALAHDESTVQSADRAFEIAYRDKLSSIEAVEGAELTFQLLRESGVAIALTTGFDRDTMNAIIDQLGWRELVDVALCPADVGRGRPFPDLPLTALMRTGAHSVDSMIVVGDTVNDVRSGLAAGAGLVAGVLTGAHSGEQLHQAGADEVLTSVASLPAMLGITAADLAPSGAYAGL